MTHNYLFSGNTKANYAVITALLTGEKAHASLLGTLLIIEARMTTDTQLVIQFIKTKVDGNGKITDNKTYKYC